MCDNDDQSMRQFVRRSLDQFASQSINNERPHATPRRGEGRKGGGGRSSCAACVLVVRGIFRSARATINNGGLVVCCCYPGRGPWNFRIPRQIPSSNLPPFFRCVHNLWHSCCIFKVWEHLKFRRMHIVWRRGVPKSGNPARQSRPRPVIVKFA